ncbi:NAD(P)H-hydrate epimerase [Candidatus Riflebacteria bacterium]
MMIRKAFDPGKMSQLDSIAIKDFKIPGIVLMENAALKTFLAIKEKFLPASDASFLVFCGKGNNGADGLAIARHLHVRGYNVKCFIFCAAAELSKEGKTHYSIANELGIKIFAITSKREISKIKRCLNQPGDPPLLIDAIFGTGFRSTTRGIYKQVIDVMNSVNSPIISVDIPSGINGWTGRASGSHIKADLTVTFQYPKQGLFFHEALDACGEIRVENITIPPSIPAVPHSFLILNTKEIKARLPTRVENSYKGSYGKLGIWAGSISYPGAARLTGHPGFAVGAGMIYLFSESSEYLHNLNSEIIPRIWNFNEPGKTLKEFLALDALVIGPGVDFSTPGSDILFEKIIEAYSGPILLDASALRLIAERNLWQKKNPDSQWILTPHPGEFFSLFSYNVETLLQDNLSRVTDFCQKNRCHLILKLPRSLIFTDGERYLIPFGSQALARAGSGDLLSGLVGGLLVQQPKFPGHALIAGAFLHALSGKVIEELGCFPSDIVEFLPQLTKKIKNTEAWNVRDLGDVGDLIDILKVAYSS